MERINTYIGGRSIPPWFVRLTILICIVGGILWVGSSWSAGFKSPEECLAYTGDAHLNCLYAYIEIQKDKISKLEKGIQTQKDATQKLQDRVSLQASMTEQLTRQLEDQKNKNQGYQFNIRRPYSRFYYGFGGPTIMIPFGAPALVIPTARIIRGGNWMVGPLL